MVGEGRRVTRSQGLEVKSERLGLRGEVKGQPIRTQYSHRSDIIELNRTNLKHSTVTK